MTTEFSFHISALGKPLLPFQSPPTFEYKGKIRLIENRVFGEGVFTQGGCSRDFHIVGSSENYLAIGQFWPTCGAYGAILGFRLEEKNNAWEMIPQQDFGLTYTEILLTPEPMADQE
ncbi:MAG: hypothetical protein WC227_02135 [Patescibacteria group bacterium]|jgi:hypothetical protein